MRDWLFPLKIINFTSGLGNSLFQFKPFPPNRACALMRPNGVMKYFNIEVCKFAFVGLFQESQP